jgi:Na+-translocating ferredoxin:NAD+ oxidoreductase RnfG subunit
MEYVKLMFMAIIIVLLVIFLYMLQKPTVIEEQTIKPPKPNLNDVVDDLYKPCNCKGKCIHVEMSATHLKESMAYKEDLDNYLES